MRDYLLPHEVMEFYRICARIDAAGNSGEYLARSRDKTGPFTRATKPLRAGIIYFSKGHGWRVRKKPKHWREVFKERFNYPPDEIEAKESEDHAAAN